MPSFSLEDVNPPPEIPMFENDNDPDLERHPENVVGIEDVDDDGVDDNNSRNDLAVYNGDLDVELDNLNEIEGIFH